MGVFKRIVSLGGSPGPPSTSKNMGNMHPHPPIPIARLGNAPRQAAGHRKAKANKGPGHVAQTRHRELRDQTFSLEKLGGDTGACGIGTG